MKTRKVKSKLAFGVEPAHRRFRLRLARYQALGEALRDEAKRRASSRPLRVLDVGCGQGRSLRYAEALGILDELRFHGLDNDPRRLARLYRPDLWSELKLGDAADALPYSDAEFDVCICEQVLEHLGQPETTIDEMFRVLRPEGLLIIGVPIFPPGIASIRSTSVALLERSFGWRRSHVQSFTAQCIAGLVCKDRPLTIEAMRGFRVASGGLLSRLEDSEWWYLLNRRLGSAAPWICTEVQVLSRKRASLPSETSAAMTGAGVL